jgi:hypothetical protein
MLLFIQDVEAMGVCFAGFDDSRCVQFGKFSISAEKLFGHFFY